MIASVRLRVAIPAALVVLAGLLPLGYPAGAAARATSGVNLLENPQATAGATSAQGWDAVTIPGWQVAAGLPTVVRYGTAGFPSVTGAWPASRGRIFAGGAGGTARLVQDVSLLGPSGRPAPSGTRYQLSAWLGGMANSWSEVVVRFWSASNRLLASAAIGPVGRVSGGVFSPRAGGGPLPAGTASAQVTIVLATSLTDDNGPGTVTPIDLGTDQAVAAIGVGSFPSAIVISPRGGTAYVANYGSDTVTPIDTATEEAGPPIPAGYAPDALAVTPSGQVLYVVDGNSDEVTPIVTATGRPGPAVAVGYSPVAVMMLASGSAAYVVSSIAGTVTPLATATGRAGPPISVGLYSYPTGLAVSGPTAVIVDSYAGQISLIDTSTGHVFAPVTVGTFPVAVAISG